MAPLLPLFFSFFLLFSPLFSSSFETPVSLRLHRLALPSHPDPFQGLAGLATSSLLRAQLLKNPKLKSKIPYTHAPLFPHSYGGYSLTLSFGTPPQPIPLLLDTGSHLTWLPCTRSYLCRNCSSPSNPSATFPVFLPKSSSSARLLGCRNPKCSFIHPSSFLSSCSTCNSSDCSQLCPPYAILYGSGSTAGILLSETLDLTQQRKVANFTVGCSLFSVSQPSGGIAGFGRGPASLPSQLGLKRFSYCLISRRFDDNSAESGSVVLEAAKDSSSTGVRFTPFINNPASGADSIFSVYYYVELKKIMVEGKKVKIPQAALAPGADGTGGTIIDSGTTFTYMESAVLDPLAASVEAAVAGRLNRWAEAEAAAGLRPCFELPSGPAEVQLPELALHFKGGAKMRLPLANYFAFAGDSAVCLTIVSDDGVSAAGGGPSIILGNFQQQNYYIVYDLEKQRLGFRQQSLSDISEILDMNHVKLRQTRGGVAHPFLP